MFIKLKNEELVRIHNILAEKSVVVKNMVDCFNIEDLDTFEIPLDTTKEDVEILSKYLQGYKYELGFEKICDLLLLTHFLDIPDLYELFCMKVNYKIKWKKEEEILDLFRIEGEDREKMLKNEDFIYDLYRNKDKIH